MAATHYREQTRGLLINQIYSALAFMSLTNRDYEGDAQTSQTVRIIGPADRVTDATPANTTRANAAWPTAGDQTTQLQELVMDQRALKSEKVFVDDALEVPYDMVANAVKTVARHIAYQADNYIATQMLAGVSSASPDHILTVGDATNYIPITGDTAGKPVTQEARYLVPEAFVTVAGLMRARGVWRTGEMENMPFCIMDQWMWAAIQNAILREKFSDFKVDIYAGLPGSMDGVMSGGFVGAINGIPVLANINVPTETVSSKTHTPILFATPKYCTAAFREPVQQLWDPATNPTSDIGWLYRAYMNFGAKVVQTEYAWKVQVRTET